VKPRALFGFPVVFLTVCASLGLWLIGAGQARAADATLYVDRADPACSDGGSGNQSQPFCTIGAAAGLAVAGQTVLIASGIYAENVTVANSGTLSAPIVFAAASGASVTVTGGAHGFTISGRSWITVRGITVTGTSSDGIYVSSSSNITLASDHVTFAGKPKQGKVARGIRLTGATNPVVTGCVLDHNTEAGIYLVNGTTGAQIVGNELFANARQYTRAAPGIDVRAVGNTIEWNISHDNEDSGLQFYPGAANNLVIGNVAYDNGDHGIDDYQATGQRIIGNSIYRNVTAGINLEGGSSGGFLANNISVDNGINSPRTSSNIRVDSTSTSGTSIDHDLVYLHQGTNMVIWGSTFYSSLAALVAATGQEAHGMQADPRWVDAAGGDLHLLGGSPAIDSANSGVSGEPTTDADGNGRLDDPATPNSGVGPRPFDDRGAYEYQPGGGTTDAPPSAALSVTPSSGTAPLEVTADASGSTDTDATPIASYTFDFGDGSTVVGPKAGATATHTYTTAGTYTVTVTVTDTADLSSTATARVTAQDTADQNLVGNPGFETNTSGWNTSGSGVSCSLARLSGGHSGSFSAAMTNTSSATGNCTLNDSPNWALTTSAGTYTGTIWVRADAGAAVLKLRFREYVGSTLAGSATTQVTLTTSWQKVTVAYTTVSPGSSTLDFNAYVSSLGPSASFSADDASIVLG
jgi:parallel beta-helix repeat protein